VNGCENCIWWVEKTLGDGGVSICNIHIFKSYHAPRGFLGEGTQYNCMRVLQLFFCSKFLGIIRTLRVYPSDEDIAL
jgi:hypothetical protein